jgi:phage shock protein C
MAGKKFLHLFTKSKKDRWLAGICGGLAQRTPLPAWTWRMLFVLTAMIYGIGIFIYIVLWVLAPSEGGD